MKTAVRADWCWSVRSGNNPAPVATRPAWRIALALGAALALLHAAPAAAQEPANPVYLDDSSVAVESLLGLDSQIAAGNLDAGVRVLQKLLDEEGSRVVPARGQVDLYISVRTRVHQVLLANPRLLEHYRKLTEGRARDLLEGGDAARAEETCLLTTAGFEGALLLAIDSFEAGHFDAAL
ncbi:MAG: hypothetical protein H7Y88_09885, partial [Phycisphaerales bacterium]|nr:hypothetical protein [Phycisphaerales bacterium]